MTKVPANTLNDHYRLGAPANGFRLSAAIHGPPVFFRHGPLTLYGRTSQGAASPMANQELPVLPDGDGELSFDPNEVVTNLRHENYLPRMGGTGGARLKGLMRQMYYSLRPLFPVAFRKHLQRRFLAGWQDTPFPAWPVDRTVDRLLETLLWDHLTETGCESAPFIWFWPDGRRGCVTITHDVETASGRDFSLELAELDLQFGFTPAFQFIPETRYRIDPELQAALSGLGAEINVHGLNHDGHLFDNEQVFLDRVARINRYGRDFGSRGFRSPVLYRNPDWFEHLEFEYEMSIPNVGHLDPQRGGCCTVFPYFIGDLMEIPLTTIQDYSLFHILGDYSIDLWCQQLEIITGAHGLACFNIHPDYVITPRENEVFRSLLAHLQAQVEVQSLWAAAPGEIATWWNQRAKMELSQDDGSWTIHGSGSERARIAHARRTPSGLVMEL